MPVKTFKVYPVSSRAYYGSSWTCLLDEANQLVGVVDGENERRRLLERIALDKAEGKTIANHWVLWLETTHRSSVNSPPSGDDDEMVMEEWTAKQGTNCVIGDATTPTRWPLPDRPLLQE